MGEESKLGGSDPKNLEGQAENGKAREFFWDSVTNYVVGVIVVLAAIDTVIEFIRGSSISCNTIGDVNGEFINNYCASSVPVSEYYPAFVAVHAILILIPHYLWANRYSGYFDFFFKLAETLDRSYYSENNYNIADQLDKAFTTYNQRGMYIFYVLKLIVQLLFTLGGFFLAIFFFTDFNEVFLCPSTFPNVSISSWPLDGQVTCVFKSIRLFAVIRLIDLILLMILILLYVWSLIWCLSSHTEALGTKEVAKFSFQSSISPRYHLFDSSILNNYDGLVRKVLHAILLSVPLCGSGPRIENNLDFLMLKLFRTDSGLGYMLRDMQILLRIKDLNDNDLRITKLHRFQQRPHMKGGDLIRSDDIKGADRDIVWKFEKEAGKPGLFYPTPVPPILSSEDLLVIPMSMRAIVLGFAALSTCRRSAMFITFGSTSLGIPSALARVFNYVYVLNFNSEFKMDEENDKFYVMKDYSLGIQTITYPEDILSSEVAKSNDFGEAVEDMVDVDFIVIGPVEKEFYTSTLSLSLDKLTPVHLKEDAMLLTIYPTKIGSMNAAELAQFHHFVPSPKYFGVRDQTILETCNKSPTWPPAVKQDTSGEKLSSWTARIPIGATHSHVTFKLYDRITAKNSESTSDKKNRRFTSQDKQPFR